MRQHKEEESKRDITFEEYKTRFIDHIEGKAALDRTQHASDEEELGLKDRSRTRSKGHVSQRDKASNKNE